MFNPHKFVYWVRSLPFSLFMYLKEKQYKIAMILLCPIQGPWASSTGTSPSGFKVYILYARLFWTYYGMARARASDNFLCPRHKMARGHLVFALSVLLSFRPSVPLKFIFSTPPTSLHGFEWNLVQMLYHKSRSACGEIIHVWQILAELWPLTLRTFYTF